MEREDALKAVATKVERASAVPPVRTAAATNVANVSATPAADTATKELDAVAVSLTAEHLRKDKVSKSASEKTVAAEVSEAESKLAEYLQTVASNNGKTSVKFDVQAQREGEHLLSFRVVNEDTGEVIREFPPEELVKAHLGLDKKSGMLLDSLI